MEKTVAQKLEALAKLQKIDSQLDALRKVRGDLPEEVQDLEDEIGRFDTRVDKIKKEIEALDDSVKEKKASIKDAERLIQKYEEQQMNVRNNREYDAITKEKELKELDIQIANKNIKEAKFRIDDKKDLLISTKTAAEERKKDLEAKKGELTQITKETEVEEAKLIKERETSLREIGEERLTAAYHRLRSNSSNGLAVVNVQRGACGGCFNMVPPQRQADIKEKKKIIVCEHCGRIFADVDPVIIEEKKPATRRKAPSAAAVMREPLDDE